MPCFDMLLMFWLIGILSISGLVLHGLVEHAAQNHFAVFQGQERDTSINELGTPKSPIIPPNPDLDNNLLGLGDQQLHSPIYPCPSGTVLFSGGNITTFGLPNNYYPLLISHGILENDIGSKNFPVLNATSYCSGSPERKTENEVPHPHAPPCMVFGVNLVSNPPELPSPQVYSNHDSHESVHPMSPSSVSQGTNSVHQCNNGPCSTNIHCIKVLDLLFCSCT